MTACVSNRQDVVASAMGGKTVGVFLSAPAIEPVVHGAVNKALAPLAHLVAALPFMRRVTKSNDIRADSISHCPKVVARYGDRSCGEVYVGDARRRRADD